MKRIVVIALVALLAAANIAQFVNHLRSTQPVYQLVQAQPEQEPAATRYGIGIVLRLRPSQTAAGNTSNFNVEVVDVRTMDKAKQQALKKLEQALLKAMSEQQIDNTLAPLEVAAVVPGSPADQAGIKPGDVIVRANGNTLHMSRFDEAVDRFLAGDKDSLLDLQLVRGDQRSFLNWQLLNVRLNRTVPLKLKRPAWVIDA
jgi:hypothetical protein